MFEMLLYIFTVSLVWGLLFCLTVKRVFDAPFLFFTMSAVFILIPAFYHLFFDPVIEKYMILQDPRSAYLKQALVIIIYACGILLGYLATKTAPIGQALFPNFNYRRVRTMEITALVVLFLLAFVAIMPFLLQAGNVFGAIETLRYSDILEGISFVAQFSTIGSYICAAVLLHLLYLSKHEKKQSATIVTLVSILFILMLLMNTLLGGKSGVVYPLFIFFMGYALCIKQAPIRTLILPFLFLLAMIPALEYARNAFIKQTDYEDVRRVVESALTVNLMYHNLKYLEVADALELNTLGEDFYNGIVGVIPRSIWADKPEAITVGGRFRRAIHPTGHGGRPVFGYNQWYTNFGWLGVLIGGIITGWLLRILQVRYKNLHTNPYSFILSSLFTFTFLLRAGLDNTFLVKYIMFVVPFFLYKLATMRSMYPRTLFVKSG